MNKQQEEALVAEFRQMTPGERDFFLQTARVMTRERKKNMRGSVAVLPQLVDVVPAMGDADQRALLAFARASVKESPCTIRHLKLVASNVSLPLRSLGVAS